MLSLPTAASQNPPHNAPEPWISASSDQRFFGEFLVQILGTLREWLGAHATLLSAGLGLVGVTLVGVTWFEFQSTLSQAQAATSATESGPEATIATTTIPTIYSSSSSSSKIRAHIAGAVRKPGVYELSGTSVVQDLVTLAGGLSGLVWQDYLDEYINLAAPLSPNQKVWIPTLTQKELLQSSLTTELVAGASEATQNQSPSQATHSSLISINTASVAQLDTLADIGQKRAEAIVANRPYTTIEELTSKAGVPASIVSKLKNQLSL